jgi:hypothetical protein
VDDLHVDGKLATAIVDDHDADRAATVGKGVVEVAPEATLVDDGEALLDITRLGHSNDVAVLADVENAVLLEDGTEHVLDNDGWRGVGDEAALLVKGLGEEVDTEVAVLASLGAGGDADDLAGTALEDEEVADADVVAWDGDGVGSSTTLDETDGFAAGSRCWCSAYRV